MTLFFIIVLGLCTIAGIAAAVQMTLRRAKFLPLDITAFDKLMDSEDERFLRRHLSLREFFRIKRLRIRVTARYLAHIAGNAAAVVSCITD